MSFLRGRRFVGDSPPTLLAAVLGAANLGVTGDARVRQHKAPVGLCVTMTSVLLYLDVKSCSVLV